MRFWLKIFEIVIVFSSLSLPCRLDGAEEQHVATITKFFGKAQILSHPSSKKQGNPPHVLFEEKYYSIESARIGSKLRLGSVIQTAEKAMVRLVYENGDQIMVSASSSYRVTSEKKEELEKPISELIYGKFRAVISKDGPRRNLEVRTRTMVMGIRGTDFHVAALDDSGGSVVTVLRGAVAVRSNHTAPDSAPLPIEVQSGFNARIADATKKIDPKAGKPSIELAATDKLDLRLVQESVSFKKGEGKMSADDQSDTELQKNLIRLEQVAVEATKSDIKANDAALYKKIIDAEAAGKRINNVEILQAVTLHKALVMAPEPSLEKVNRLQKKVDKTMDPKKPKSQDLEGLDGDVYDQYFKR